VHRNRRHGIRANPLKFCAFRAREIAAAQRNANLNDAGNVTFMAANVFEARLEMEAAGERFDTLELNAWLSVAEISEDTSTTVDALTGRFGAARDDVLASPIVLVGSASEVVERVLQRRERWGYSYIVVQGSAARAFAPVVASLRGK